jgi:transposase-like protein
VIEVKKTRRQSPQHRWTRSPAKEKYWRTQIALWQESGLSVRAFCKEHGVVETSFYAWRREMIIRARETGFTEEITEPGRMTPNTLKDGRGRTVSIRFRQTDHRALNTLVEEKSESPFVPLKLVPDEKHTVAAATVSQGITVTTPSGYRVSVHDSDSLNLLTKILTALENAQC